MDERGNTKVSIFVTLNSIKYAFERSMSSIRREPEIKCAASLAVSGGTRRSMERMAE